ncbi:MAG: hypothetical protein ACXWRP_16450 [Bdellovibrio sp.]
MNGKFYQNWFARANKEFPRTGGWKKALSKARTREAMVYSDKKVDLSNKQRETSGSDFFRGTEAKSITKGSPFAAKGFGIQIH